MLKVKVTSQQIYDFVPTLLQHNDIAQTSVRCHMPAGYFVKIKFSATFLQQPGMRQQKKGLLLEGDPYGEVKYIAKLHFGDIKTTGCYREVAVVER